MSVVDFKQITYYDIPVHPETPIITMTEGTVYDDDWGYYTFQQGVSFEYNPGGKYRSNAQFTINGVFTTNATPPAGPEPSGGFTSEDRFNALKAKYNSLVSYLATASEAEPPSNLDEWGTINDSRVVPLPNPLSDSSGGIVYARPVSIDFDETQWPNLISYTAVLSEPDLPLGKVVVDGHILDDGIITINAKKPRTRNQNFAFANSAEIYFGGFDPRSYQVSGKFPKNPPPGGLSNQDIENLVESLMDGKVNIGRKIGNTVTYLYTDLFIDQSSVTISLSSDGKGIDVSLSARH